MATEEAKIKEILGRGVSETIHKESLEKKLRSGKKLRVKLGIDPTSPHLHLGRAIPILKLRDFQEAGHQVVFIVGDFTAVIGDTSDKESERPMLTKEKVKENLTTYLEQAGRVLDLSKTETHFNSEWLAPLQYEDIGKHADLFSVSDFIDRENIKRRLDQGLRVSLREVLYPLMQGYDSVAVKADVELGGTDQRFNLLAGRTLQEAYGQEPQDIIMNPLIAGLDGRKMSSSWGNTINLDTPPNDMYGKVMSLDDSLIIDYQTLMTRIPMEEVEANKKALTEGRLHPKDAKMHLAREIVKLYWGEREAEVAEKFFVDTFQKGKIPEDIQIVEVVKSTFLVDVLLNSNLVASKTEFRRLITSGAISNMTTSTTVEDPETKLVEDGVFQIGKRRFLKVVVK